MPGIGIPRSAALILAMATDLFQVVGLGRHTADPSESSEEPATAASGGRWTALLGFIATRASVTRQATRFIRSIMPPWRIALYPSRCTCR